jgi:hypothetical protein
MVKTNNIRSISLFVHGNNIKDLIGNLYDIIDDFKQKTENNEEIDNKWSDEIGKYELFIDK